MDSELLMNKSQNISLRFLFDAYSEYFLHAVWPSALWLGDLQKVSQINLLKKDFSSDKV